VRNSLDELELEGNCQSFINMAEMAIFRQSAAYFRHATEERVGEWIPCEHSHVETRLFLGEKADFRPISIQ
jgi:hypothetical protein